MSAQHLLRTFPSGICTLREDGPGCLGESFLVATLSCSYMAARCPTLSPSPGSETGEGAHLCTLDASRPENDVPETGCNFTPSLRSGYTSTTKQMAGGTHTSNTGKQKLGWFGLVRFDSVRFGFASGEEKHKV